MRKVSASSFQTEILELFKKKIGCTPNYYDVTKNHGRRKWTWLFIQGTVRNPIRGILNPKTIPKIEYKIIMDIILDMANTGEDLILHGKGVKYTLNVKSGRFSVSAPP